MLQFQSLECLVQPLVCLFNWEKSCYESIIIFLFFSFLHPKDEFISL